MEMFLSSARRHICSAVVAASSQALAQEPAAALIVLVFEDASDKLAKQAQLAELDKAVDGAISAHAIRAEYRGAACQILDLTTFGRLPASRVLLVGLGPKKGFEPGSLAPLKVKVVVSRPQPVA